jgi:uncharacterized lipoprotein YbaY
MQSSPNFHLNQIHAPTNIIESSKKALSSAPGASEAIVERAQMALPRDSVVAKILGAMVVDYWHLRN